MKNIAIFASGNGTNAENIIKYFQHSQVAQVKLLLSDNAAAAALEKAQRLRVKTFTFKPQELSNGIVLNIMKSNTIDFIVLAGFLKFIPESIIDAYENRMLNIHPSLLPKFGGKGMYGDNVHKAVIAAGEKQSGITIHRVDKEYDNGSIVFQKAIMVEKDDNPKTLAAKIHKLEYDNYPEIIKQEIEKCISY